MLTEAFRSKVEGLSGDCRQFFFFFQALNFLVESFGLLNDLFTYHPFLDAGYPVFIFI
jgi:hypothetical protein